METGIRAEHSQLSPLVYWAQTKDQITLKIDLKDVKASDIRIDDEGKLFKFKAFGLGARGVNDYHFALNLYSEIKETLCVCRVLDSKIDVTLQKSDAIWWPRLIAQPQKPHWLKIDFDRWASEDDDDLAAAGDETMPPSQEAPQRNIRQDYPGMFERLEKEEYGYIREHGKKVYLIIYNLAQFVGYLYIICVMSVLYYRDGVDSIPHTYETVGNAMKFCQLLQYLEAMHPLFGYTKGSVLMPFLQVSGRNFILFVMIEMESRMQSKPVVFYLFFIWSLIEVIRYPYYVVSILKREIRLLTWLRYTAWIPLYPMGMVCEGIVLLRNILYFEQTKRFSISLPNPCNISFSMTNFIKFYLLVLIFPGAYYLMTHMAKLRGKKLKTGRTRARRSHFD